LKECHVSNVPSFDSFRKLQDRLRKTCGSQPTLHTSSLGNVFHVNDVRESVARVRKCFHYDIVMLEIALS
jgi:hypothetical protein